MPLDSQNRYMSCASNAFSAIGLLLEEDGEYLKHTFLEEGSQQTSPFDEQDYDEDGYVECVEYDRTNWILSGGSFSVVGGSDCDDADAKVYPTATE